MSTQLSTREEDNDLESIDRVGFEIVQGGAISAITKSEVEAQLDAAHKYPRKIKQFLDEAITLATYNEDIAASCIYSVPRGGKNITGPSVRLAEICISAYRNLHVGARVIGAEDKEVVSQGVCWDLEKNIRITIEKRRKITDKSGKRFNEDMINVTGNAAASIALRDSAFRVIPRTYVNVVYEAARSVAVGNASTLSARRATVVEKLVKMGAMLDRILARVGKSAVEDIGLTELEVLIGLGTAIHSGSEKLDDIFPAPARDTGKVDLATVRPGTEENRGHGNENLGPKPATETKAAPAETQQPKPETKASAPETKNPEAPFTDEQHALLESLRQEQNIEAKVWLAWAKKKFDVRMVANLKQKDFDACVQWTKNAGRE